jgi:hypothetical protein
MNHYYFAATLPLLTLGEPPRLSGAEFVSACEQHLSAAAAAAATALIADTHAPTANGDGFPGRWHNAESQMRNAIARVRAARRGVDLAGRALAVGNFDVALEAAVDDAFGQPNPLARERALDTYRWKKADELAGHDSFSTAAILAYAVKLGIAQRWSALEAEAGSAAARALIDQDEAREETLQ